MVTLARNVGKKEPRSAERQEPIETGIRPTGHERQALTLALFRRERGLERAGDWLRRKLDSW